jgi:hypothetical protein
VPCGLRIGRGPPWRGERPRALAACGLLALRGVRMAAPVRAQVALRPHRLPDRVGSLVGDGSKQPMTPTTTVCRERSPSHTASSWAFRFICWIARSRRPNWSNKLNDGWENRGFVLLVISSPMPACGPPSTCRVSPVTKPRPPRASCSFARQDAGRTISGRLPLACHWPAASSMVRSRESRAGKPNDRLSALGQK